MTFHALRARLYGSLSRRAHDRRLSEEVDTHLALLTDEFIARGLSADEARRAARREFGGVTAITESARDEHGFPALAAWAQDIRFALRQLRRQPGFALAAILTLAIGIGGTAGIFSVVDVVLLRPLPFPDAERLVVLHERLPDRGHIPVSPADADAWRLSTSSFDQIGLMLPGEATITGVGTPVKVPATGVTPAALALLSPRLELGRLFLENEGVEGQGHVAIVGYRLWQQLFDGDRGAVGRALWIDGEPFTLVGVLGRDAQMLDAGPLYDIPLRATGATQVWTPLTFTSEDRRSIGNNSFGAIARLRPGVSLAQARADLASAQTALIRSIPSKGDMQTAVVPLREQIAGRARGGLLMLTAAVVAVLLVGCANIVNLLLARALVRRREMAVRLALGAGRGRLMRQVFTEQLTLCALGGLASLVVAYAAIQLLVWAAPGDLPRLQEIGFTPRVAWVTLAASFACAVLIAILPALRAGDRGRIVEAMTTRTPGGARTTVRLRSALVVAQIGLSVACLVAGALLLQRFVGLLRVDRGFDPSRLLTVRLDLVGPRYEDPNARVGLMNDLAMAAGRVGGVISVAVADRLPLTGTGANSALSTEGTTLPVPQRPVADTRSVTPAYFQTLGLPLQRGRLLTEADRNRQVAVLSASLAAQGWPGEDPIGRRFRFGGSNPQAPLFEVVGVVGDARNRSLDEPPTDTAYVPYPARTASSAVLLVKATGDSAATARQLGDIIRAREPELPVPTMRMLDDVAVEALAVRRFQLQLVVLFAVTAAVLTLVGVYGLMAYTVAQRTAEFGVRLALGAPPGGLVRLILRDAAVLSLAGVLAAVPVLAVAHSALRRLLVDLSPPDSVTAFAVSAGIVCAALLAAYVPGRRASRINPMVALRSE